MERYTEKHYDGNGYYLICSGNCETLNCGDCGILDKIVDRLAAYEETGLEPGVIQLSLDFIQEYTAGMNSYEVLKAFDRLHELAQADKENRVLPEGSGWFVTCSGKKLTVVMDIETALRREQDG